MRVIAPIDDRGVVEKMLHHLGVWQCALAGLSLRDHLGQASLGGFASS
jgi:hypothetical protein